MKSRECMTSSKKRKNQNYFDMITEQYVTFETSKMLDEAGFDFPTRCFNVAGY